MYFILLQSTSMLKLQALSKMKKNVSSECTNARETGFYTKFNRKGEEASDEIRFEILAK